VGNAYVQQIVTEKLAEAVRMDTAMIQKDAPFTDYGLDSIISVSFVRAINETLELELEPVTLFEYSTVGQLSEYIWTTSKKRIRRQFRQARPASPEPDDSTDANLEEIEPEAGNDFESRTGVEAGAGPDAGFFSRWKNLFGRRSQQPRDTSRSAAANRH
jgi:acyl carrier protein